MPGLISSIGLGGSPATKSIVNRYSAGGVSAANVEADADNAGRELLSGALTANTLKTILTVSGAGQCCLLSAYSKDATARTVRLVVICDGTTVFDATSSSVSATNSGIVAVGNGASSAYVPGPAIRWNTSLTVQVASSLTETDKVAAGYSLM